MLEVVSTTVDQLPRKRWLVGAVASTVTVLLAFSAVHFADGSSTTKGRATPSLSVQNNNDGIGRGSPAATATDAVPTQTLPPPQVVAPPLASPHSQVLTTTGSAPVSRAGNSVAPAQASVTQLSVAQAVFNQLNSERASNGLPPLAMNAKLVSSAHAHNLSMAAANSMSHQLPGEPSLGQRITAVGYSWHAVGENIAYSTVKSTAEALRLETAMYIEVPPDDGHRRNILSSTFTEIGVDVIFDAPTGKMWLTEDFGRP